MIRRYRFHLLIIAVLTILLTACSGNGTPFFIDEAIIEPTPTPTPTPTPKEPTVGELKVSDITKTSAVCTFSYNSPDIDVQYTGICYSTTEKNPTTNDITVSDSANSKSGIATHNMTGLKENTTYYVRPCVTTSLGTTYGITVQFTTNKASSPSEDDNPTPNY